MYVKPQRRHAEGMFVPQNYHGTAFPEQEPEQTVQEQAQDIPQEAQQAPLPDAVATAKKEEGGLLSSLFSGFGGLHSDDVLLLALILLLSRSDKDSHSASELLPLLALLLFIG